ncbi:MULTISPECIES: hypothetical protein [unclassified Ruegeria]|uniref:hypothetical protein n=1 Tax=unclassified Ruegeria TaxID=2625375 RepID=UPI00149261B1|nr:MULTISPECIES: hypothetical protein [unclassified Ruegeria]NOD87423.1 hypothetical protein [Ruegeria sp. HKCCD4318]NOE12978.1 hypothetical protein [Ruegeria sp. HKCCD4318-2]NOG08855.1 hypothetical protein [Ruegeria sp. HKCCD4315]
MKDSSYRGRYDRDANQKAKANADSREAQRLKRDQLLARARDLRAAGLITAAKAMEREAEYARRS